MDKFDLYKKKTFTSHWNNFSQKPKNHSPSRYLKKFRKHLSNFFGFKLSIKVSKNISNLDETFTSYQTDNDILKYRNFELLNVVQNFLKYFNLKCSEQSIKKFIKEYVSVYSKSPIKDLGSGFGFNEGLFLFCIVKVIKPTLVIESGVMKGFTTYLIDSASTRNCIINCYDINFDNLEYKSKKATYFNHDIMNNKPNLKNQKVLAFWDDHTSQLDRLTFSIKESIKYNFFDDDLSFLNFHSDGWPPIPTISMLKEVKNKVITSDQVNWICRNQKGQLWLSKLKENNPADKIAYHKIFPDLFNKTGYKNHSQCSFLITK